MLVSNGKLTYDAEGTEGGRYHSRILHVPSSNSGLTIGRGYDMATKSAAKILTDLKSVGLDERHSIILSNASGRRGNDAEQFVFTEGLGDFEISTEVQENLFKISYKEISDDVQRICNKSDCVAAYGEVDWDNLNHKIKDALIDLRFRGDYTSTSRRLIQPLVASNDLDEFTLALSNKSNWANVPDDRFNRRVEFLNHE